MYTFSSLVLVEWKCLCLNMYLYIDQELLMCVTADIQYRLFNAFFKYPFSILVFHLIFSTILQQIHLFNIQAYFYG